MTTYNTLNAVPSADARDRYDNSQVFDELMNGAAPTTPDRLGVLRQSWGGMEQSFNQFLVNSGFEPNHLTYVEGTELQVLRPTQLIDRSGSVYRIKMPATFPVMLAGAWATDASKLVEVGDAALRAELASATGAALSGYGATTVSGALDMLTTKVVWSDDPAYVGDLQTAANALISGGVLNIRGVYAPVAPVVFADLNNIDIIFHPGGSIVAPPTWALTANRGVFVFSNCSRVDIYSPDITGACVAHPTDNADGDAGIQFLNCLKTRVFGGWLRSFMTWGIIHENCQDTLVNGTKINALTQQSGIGHADCIKYAVHKCDISDSGLYGVECEGINNQDGTVTENDIALCLKGVIAVRGANSTVVKNNRIKSCDIALSMTSIANAQRFNTYSGNELLNSRVEYELVGTNFASVTRNRGAISLSVEYLHRSPQDYISLVVDTTQVRVRSTLPIAVGDVHRYAAGDYTVTAVTTVTDARYGEIPLVSYASTTGLKFGAAFRRAVNLQNERFFAQVLGGTESLTLRDNEGDGYQRVYYLGGTINGSHIGPNQISNSVILFDTTDGTPATNTKIIINDGDLSVIQNIAFGESVAKAWPSLIAERRILTMGKASATGFTLPVEAMLTRVRLAIFTSSGATSPVTLNLNGTPIITIPAAEFGLAVTVTRELIMSAVSASFMFDVTGGGEMTFATATVECSILNFI